MTEQRITAKWKIVLASCLCLIGAALWIVLLIEPAGVGTWNAVSNAVSVGFSKLVATLSLFVGVNLFLTHWRDRRSAALLRLDWFLPMLRRIPKEQSPSKSWLGRSVRRWTSSLQSNWQTKKRGLGRRWLRWLGLSWVASPLRRISQTICFLLFCTLFLYVCWPYDAKPTVARVIKDVTFENYDQGRDAAKFRSSENSPTELYSVWVYEERSQEQGDVCLLGQFSVLEQRDGWYWLRAKGELTAEFVDLITGVSEAQDYAISDSDPTAWPSHYADNLEAKEFIPAESFLVIDPLVSLSTAIASRSWVWSLTCAGGILLACVLIPRGFCGYVCPLGTTIDLFDWAVAGRVKRFNVPGDGWWVHVKYYLLAGILFSAVGGILVSGFFSAIPVLTRGLLFILDPFQNGSTRGWHLVPAVNAGQWLSIGLFLAVLGLGFLRTRFWCKYVCPSGAVFSLGNLFRATERKVEDSCIHCNKCVEICPFDAIKPDFTTRETDCTLCQSCAGVCPTHAIKFVERSNLVQLKLKDEPPTHETALGRRGFLSLTAGTAASIAGAAGTVLVGKTFGAGLDNPEAFLPVRPPGSVPEREFLEMCIRCGECFKACPNNVLQPEAFEQGFEGLWTPMVKADWAGCESSCNACGQVCPTGAIRELALDEKRYARMGLAIVNEETCLPFAGREECDLCVQECNAAGYRAIEYMQVGVETDEDGKPVEGSGFTAPVVMADRCVGCGLCQTRCYAINVKETHKLSASAIVVEAGEGKEDRIMNGSYRELHQIRAKSQALKVNSEPLPPSGRNQVPANDESGDESPF